jgi:glycosyltransferase involved in cell wall biosynthesis
MKILAIAKSLPAPDRSAGDLRFFHLLGFFAASHRVTLCAFGAAEDAAAGEGQSRRHRDMLVSAGVAVCGDVFQALREQTFDVVWFEFYPPALRFLDGVRRLQPEARTVVDSVDVHFNRLQAKAQLTGDPVDIARARRVRLNELEAYSRADAVVVVSGAEKDILLEALPGAHVEILPTVHPIPAARDRAERDAATLLFVGGFVHEPNVDAMLYFVNDVLPIIRREVPEVRLTIVGSAPPGEIRALESPAVIVTGFVPDTAPYLATHAVSVAPLRYGGGIKGKIGEAMAHAVPVVTTSVGIEGFGLEPGTHVLVGDTAESFARQVVRLLRDAQLRRSVGEAGRGFIEARLSDRAVRLMAGTVLERLAQVPVKRLPLRARVRYEVKALLDYHVLRRLRRASH